MDDISVFPSFHCLAGHEIPASRIEDETELVVLDAGARIQICREHGCPVAVSRPRPDPMRTAPA